MSKTYFLQVGDERRRVVGLEAMTLDLSPDYRRLVDTAMMVVFTPIKVQPTKPEPNYRMGGGRLRHPFS